MANNIPQFQDDGLCVKFVLPSTECASTVFRHFGVGEREREAQDLSDWVSGLILQILLTHPVSLLSCITCHAHYVEIL